MSDKKSTFVNMVISLFLITIVAGVSLGYVNDATLEPIAKAKLARKINALKLVLPEFDNNPVEDVRSYNPEGEKHSIEMYSAYLKTNKVGTAFSSYSEKGYSGLIRIMVGFNNEGTIKNIVVLEQKETPGLGTKMKSEKFINQFRGKDPSKFNLKVVKDGGKIDAITGATISSRAFSEATQLAYDSYIQNKDSIIQN